MKKTFLTISFFTLVFLLSYSCGEKKGPEVAEVKSYEIYTDSAVGFSVKYPSNWYVQKLVSRRFTATNLKEAVNRFINYDPEGAPGARIDIYTVKLEGDVTFDSVVRTKAFVGKDIYSAPQKVIIDSVEAIKETYKFELTDGEYKGEVYYATKDNQLATVINFSAFAGTFDQYKPVFDEALKSIKLAAIPEKKVAVKDSIIKAPPPSKNLVSHRGDGYVIMVPDNFTVINPVPPKGVLKSFNYNGERRGDSYIQVDILDASKQKDLEKIAKDFQKRFPGASELTTTTLGGQKAYSFTYNPSANVKGKVYLVLHNDKLFRITSNWFKGEEQDYFPIFERSIKTFKFE